MGLAYLHVGYDSGYGQGTAPPFIPIDPDGKTWKRECDKPVFSPEQPWEKVAFMCPHVLCGEKEKLYRMWYSGSEQYEPNAIGYATCPNGMKWTRYD